MAKDAHDSNSDQPANLEKLLELAFKAESSRIKLRREQWELTKDILKHGFLAIVLSGWFLLGAVTAHENGNPLPWLIVSRWLCAGTGLVSTKQKKDEDQRKD